MGALCTHIIIQEEMPHFCGRCKMKKTKLFFLAALCAGLLSFLAFMPEYSTLADTDTVAATDAVDDAPVPCFTKESVTVYVGWEQYLSDILDISENAVIKYKSSKSKIATVDDDGRITGIKPGKATIKATIKDNGQKYTAELKVTVKNPYSEITASTTAISVGTPFCFDLKRVGHNEPVTWTLEGSQYASIEATSPTGCRLSGKAPGDVVLHAESNGTVFDLPVKIIEGTGNVYFINPNSDPYYTGYMKYGTYNSKTKGYYLLRSYLEMLEKQKGGVLVLEPGNYVITNTLCIPSNTTIYLKDGAHIIKSKDTGTTGLTATRSLFHLASFTNAAKTGAFKGYGGEHDIYFIGEGNAAIDMNSLNCAAIVVAHCSNLTIRGIRFLNLNGNHFIELDATKNASISGCFFSGAVESNSTRKEAINLDTPDKNTNGFIQNWTSYDCTPNNGVYIFDNVFYNLESAIGTHKYTEGKPHQNVNIYHNTFIDVTTYAIRCMNWNSPNITENVIMLTSVPEEERIGIICNGAVNPNITENRFEGYTTPISFYHWQNQGSGSNYNPIYNSIDQKCIGVLSRNYIRNCVNTYIEYYPTFEDFDEETIIKYDFSPDYILS